jgi:formylglycine-generating enzyme required for sulfatase activity
MMGTSAGRLLLYSVMAHSTVTTILVVLLAAAAAHSGIPSTVPSIHRQRMEAMAAPPGFVYVPGGECWLGTDDPDADEEARPRQRVFVPSFCIGRCEVTHAEWKRFRPSHEIPPGQERYPVTNVLLEEAAAYCRFAGGRLPTDAEWEKAARGVDGRRYPWGDEFDPTRCNSRGATGRTSRTCIATGSRRGLKAVDAYPDGASPYGALNMAGNAWEWVSDLYHGDPLRRIIRGGAAGYFERDARTYHRAIEGAGVT